MEQFVSKLRDVLKNAITIRPTSGTASSSSSSSQGKTDYVREGERGISMAELQGLFMVYKNDPQGCLGYLDSLRDNGAAKVDNPT